MNGKPTPRPAPGPGDTPCIIELIPQTGLPSIYFQRSREISMSYDALIGNPDFIFNKFGPQQLNLCRPNAHW